MSEGEALAFSLLPAMCVGSRTGSLGSGLATGLGEHDRRSRAGTWRQEKCCTCLFILDLKTTFPPLGNFFLLEIGTWLNKTKEGQGSVLSTFHALFRCVWFFAQNFPESICEKWKLSLLNWKFCQAWKPFVPCSGFRVLHLCSC